MSYIRPRPDYCTFAIDGPTFVRKRGGSYWEPQDELSDLICVRNGAVVLSCPTEADAQHARGLLAAAGFTEGQDYGVAIPQIGEVVPCPGLRIEAWWFHQTIEGSSDWRPDPMPEHIRRKRLAIIEGAQKSRFALYQRIASAVDVDPGAIARASDAGSHDERVRRLVEAIRKPPER